MGRVHKTLVKLTWKHLVRILSNWRVNNRMPQDNVEKGVAFSCLYHFPNISADYNLIIMPFLYKIFIISRHSFSISVSCQYIHLGAQITFNLTMHPRVWSRQADSQRSWSLWERTQSGKVSGIHLRCSQNNCCCHRGSSCFSINDVRQTAQISKGAWCQRYFPSGLF